MFPIYSDLPKPKIKLTINEKKNSKTPHPVDFPKDLAIRISSLIPIVTAILILSIANVVIVSEYGQIGDKNQYLEF